MEKVMKNNVDYDPSNPHIRTFTDKRFYLLDIKSEDINIRDIAHSLSHICRYGGHCNRFFSVGEHSIMCSGRGSDWLCRMWGLLHDAAEAYIGDFTRPLKSMLRVDYSYGLMKISDYENHILRVIAAKFKLPLPIPDEVHRTDNALLHEEMEELWGNVVPKYYLDGVRSFIPNIREVERKFLADFEELEDLRPYCYN